jgi:hypothetical protein
VSGPENARFLVNSLIAMAASAGLTYLCFRAAPPLLNAKRWGAYVAMGFGLLLLLFTAEFIYDLYHPDRQSPDEYFGIFVVPFFVAVGLWWCIYLNLPHVRSHLNNSRKPLVIDNQG